MKTCSKYLLITIVILTVATCENTNHLHAQPDRIKDDDNTISISLDMNKENKEPVDLSVYIDSVGYIRLDNSDECLIGKIQKVFFYEGRYYIQDNKAGSVFVFDETGKFQCKISKKGRGPGEYAKISHLLI
ncbi:MAG: 6-bladed beta-propeller, partial [Prevotellaceae bacterium]|nr:6-bladed beta-propeller [Prevotellaceae bacterium]